MSLELFHFRGCVYCDRVRRVLDGLGMTWKSIEIDPWDRREVERISGQRLVPVLRDGDRVVADSRRIIAYLQERSPAGVRDARANG